MWGLLCWLLFGLLAGVVAKFLMPGRVAGGWVITIVLGLIGALVGGFLGHHLLGLEDMAAFDIRSFALAVVGAVLVLFLYGKFALKR